MPTLDELLAEALKLDPEVRSDLARRLTESVEQYREAAAAATENERERQWIQEAMRRSRELREKAAEHPLGSPPDREMVSAPRPPKPEVPPAPATRPERRKVAAKPTVKAKAKPSPKPKPKPRAASKPKPKAKPRPAKKAKPKPKPRSRRR
jgi:outer membrane biosynthesis protein TonB